MAAITAILAVTTLIAVDQGIKAKKKAKVAVAEAEVIAGEVAEISTEATAVEQTRIGVQQEQIATQAEQEKLSVRRSRRQAIREAQIQRARALNVASAAGAGESSAVSGGTASIGSNLASALGYSSQQSGLSENITMLRQEEADLSSQIAGLYGQANVLQAQQGLALSRANLYSSQSTSFFNLGMNIASTGSRFI